MNIRKLSKWFGLRWSNRIEKQLPRFEKDLLILVNRTINNSDVQFEDKLKALKQMSLQFENYKYYEGLLRLYGHFQQFEGMKNCLKLLKEKDLPLTKNMEEVITEFSLLREVNLENKEQAKELVQMYSSLKGEKLPFANEDGSPNICLKAYLDTLQPKSKKDYIDLTGILSTDLKFDLLLELFDWINKENQFIWDKTSLDRFLRASIQVNNQKKAFEILEYSLKYEFKLDSELLFRLTKLVRGEMKDKLLILLVKIKNYNKFNDKLLNWINRNNK